MTIKELARQYGGNKKVTNLTQVEDYFGRSKKSNSRILLAVVAISIPILFLYPITMAMARYIGFARAFSIILVFYLFYTWKCIAKIVLHESERVQDYLRSQRQRYASLKNFINFRSIEDGIINYGSKSVFFIECYNGSHETIVKNVAIQRFLDALYNMDDIVYDIHTHNDANSNIKFTPIYENIRKIEDTTTAKQILDMLRLVGQDSSDDTRIIRTLYVIQCETDEVGKIKSIIEKILPTDAYYVCKICNTEEVVNILEYDLGVDLNINEILLSSYSTDDLGNSSIILKSKKNKEIESEHKSKYVQRRR